MPLTVAVVNHTMPRLHTRANVLDNCRRIGSLVDHLKQRRDDVDLVVLPEYSTTGVMFDENELYATATTVPGRETGILAQACRRNRVWGVFSMLERHERHPLRPPYDTAVVIDDQGAIAGRHHRTALDSDELCSPGDATHICFGPKGIRLGIIIGTDGDQPEAWRDCAARGAELIVRTQDSRTADAEQRIGMAKAMAWANHSFVASAGATGFDGVHRYTGGSAIIDRDGHSLATCGTAPNRVGVARLPDR